MRCTVCTFLYFQGTNSTAKVGAEGDVDLATINELPGVGMGAVPSSTMDTSTQSSLSFTTQVATRYQQTKERLGLNATTASPAYDSDSDGASSDDLYGEDIAANDSGSLSRSFISP